MLSYGQCDHPAIYWDTYGVRRCTECQQQV